MNTETTQWYEIQVKTIRNDSFWRTYHVFPPDKTLDYIAHKYESVKSECNVPRRLRLIKITSTINTFQDDRVYPAAARQ